MHYFDPDPLHATWQRTSTLDWCESNYVVTSLIAEFWNSMTNITFLLLAYLGYTSSRQFAARIRLAHLLAGVVGLGSFLFHATLSYTAQLLDELPMIYTVCVLTYSIFYADVQSSKAWDRALKILLVVDAVMITLAYVWWKHPTFHQVAFGLHCAAIFFRGSHLVSSLRPSREKKDLIRLVSFAWGTQVLGFVCWNVDNLACYQLRTLRAQWVSEYGLLGALGAVLLEMHGWWHVLTGLGTYAYIVANAWMDVLRREEEHAWSLQWKYGVLPVVVAQTLFKVE